MIFKYLYPIRIPKDSIINNSINKYYKVLCEFYAFWIDKDTMKEELGEGIESVLDSYIDDVTNINKETPIDMSFRVCNNNGYVECIIDIVESCVVQLEKDQSVSRIPIDTKSDRYFQIKDKYIKATSYSIEIVDENDHLDKNIIQLTNIINDWPLSPFENITPVTIKKDMVFLNDQHSSMKIAQDLSVFWNYAAFELFVPYVDHNMQICNVDEKYLEHTQDILTRRFDIPSWKGITKYRFGNYNIHYLVTNNLKCISVYIIPIFAKTIYSMKIMTYSDITIL